MTRAAPARSAAFDVPLLVVDQLSVNYRTGTTEVPALRGVSLVVERGSTLGLAGESGCGKSTIAHAILRLLPPGTRVDGSVHFDGEDVWAMKPGRLRAVRWTEAAIVFQGALHALNPVRRVGAQIVEPMLVHATQPSRAAAVHRSRELLERVGLTADFAASYPHQLSGGQRQRVMIAMALACDPTLLIADEATTALDMMVQAQIIDLLAGLRVERGLSLIVISHDLAMLSEMCDEVAVIYAGEIVESGSSGEVLRDPLHPYARALASARPVIGDPASRMRPSGLGGDPPDLSDLPVGCVFEARCVDAVDRCRDTRPELTAVRPGRRAACLLVEAES